MIAVPLAGPSGIGPLLLPVNSVSQMWWPWICKEIGYRPDSTPRWTDKGVACVRTTEFRPGRLLLDEVRYVSESTYQASDCKAQARARRHPDSREGGILGIACVVPPGARLCLGQRMMLMRATVSSRDLMHVLNCPQRLSLVAKLTGGRCFPPPQRRRCEGFPETVPARRRVTHHRPGDREPLVDRGRSRSPSRSQPEAVAGLRTGYAEAGIRGSPRASKQVRRTRLVGPVGRHPDFGV